MTLLIALANLAFCGSRLYATLRSGRFIAIVWFLLTYFAVFFLPVSVEQEIRHMRGFTAQVVTISRDDIYSVIIFVFCFNLIFFMSEYLFSRIFNTGRLRTDWTLSTKDKYFTRLEYIFAGLLVFGTVVYGLTSQAHTYRDFVEYKGSNWGKVFLMAGAPLVTIAALRKRYLIALLGCLPFIYFSMKLHIRSFALLSLAPVAIIYLLQYLAATRGRLFSDIKKLLVIALFSFLLLATSVAIVLSKRGGDGLMATQVFPDSGMPYGTTVLMTLIDKYGVQTGFDALTLYGLNIVNPFVKLLDLPRPDIDDPPVVMAAIYDGVPSWWDIYYHYPALWYTDAYLAFGDSGLWMAVFWGLVFVFLEYLLKRNVFIFSLLLPFLTWHAYMAVRGATAGAAVPFSYAAYVVVLAALAAGPGRFFYHFWRRQRGRHRTAKTTAAGGRKMPLQSPGG